MKKEDSAQARKDILDAARHLFMMKGYVNTSIDDIGEAIGLTKGGVYYYVEKKEDLLVAIHTQLMDVLLKNTVPVMDSEGDALTKLKRWIRVYVESLKDYQSNVRIFFSEMNNFPKESLAEHTKLREMVPAMLQKILSDGIRENKIRKNIDPSIAALLILGMLNWMYIWYRSTGEWSIDKIIQHIQGIISEGITTVEEERQ